MSTIIREPRPYGRVRLYDDNSPHWFVECPADQADEAIRYHIDSHNRHFGKIAQRQRASDPRLVVAINHLGELGAYSIGSPSDEPRGFGGQPWTIHFFDGRLETTVSLWFMGEIPTDWQGRIIENATLKAG